MGAENVAQKYLETCFYCQEELSEILPYFFPLVFFPTIWNFLKT